MDVKRSILERYLEYSPDEDFNGSQGLMIAEDVERVFGSQEGLKKYQKSLEEKAKSNQDSEKKDKYKEILSIHSRSVLIKEMNRTKFKGIFGRLKREGYVHSDGGKMKDYTRMSNVEMWNYYNKISKDLNQED